MLSDEAKRVVALTQTANDAFVNGDFSDYQALYWHGDDLSLFNPFGGRAMTGPDWLERMGALIAQTFKGGESRIEPVACYEAGDLMVLVHIERQTCVFTEGGPAEPWSLRVTQVYRREAGQWRVVHRHADPLMRRRSVVEGRALAAG